VDISIFRVLLSRCLVLNGLTEREYKSIKEAVKYVCSEIWSICLLLNAPYKIDSMMG
jgi:hypothetical protein